MVQNGRQVAADTGRGEICTLWIIGLPQENARLISEHHWAVRGGHGRDTRPEETFKFVDIVGTLATTTSVLTVYGIGMQSPRPYTKYQGILEL